MSIRLIIGDCRQRLPELPDESVHCVVTSPPYFGLRDYGVAGQIWLEPTPAEFVAVMVEVFREVRRVLRKDGTLWLNLGDSYNTAGTRHGNADIVGVDVPRPETIVGSGYKARLPGLKNKELIGIPWRMAFALQADGWYLRQDIIWSKPNPMPELVSDRCTKAHEYLFLLSKSPKYHYDAEAIADDAETAGKIGGFSPNSSIAAGVERHGNMTWERGRAYVRGDTRNRRSVWTVATQPFKEAHFATFPPDLIEPCIKAGCPKGGTVLDPFGGAGTTGLVADRLQRDAILIELNPDYCTLASNRITDDAPLFATVGQ